MSQPPGFIDPNKSQYVCRLNKALYGLKQAPRAWFKKLSNSLLHWGFSCSKADTSMFIFHSTASILIVLIYVDDIIVTRSSSQLISSLVTFLHSNFALKDLGDLHFFLGLEATRTNDNLYLTQSKYIKDLLQRVQMSDAKHIATPAATKQLSLYDGNPFLDETLYRSTVGSLQYVLFTRPEIAYSVNKVCQFMHKPSEVHWQAVKRILRYLAGTINHGLCFSSTTDTTLTAFTDADHASSPDDRRSTSGFGIYLGDNLVSWSCSKQKVVSRSSTESEYRAVANIVAELVWLLRLLAELGISSKIPPMVYCDNLSATYLTANHILHARTKHIEVDHHFIREKVQDKVLTIEHVSADEQIADIFTKPLSSHLFSKFKIKLNVLPNPMSLRGDVKA